MNTRQVFRTGAVLRTRYIIPGTRNFVREQNLGHRVFVTVSPTGMTMTCGRVPLTTATVVADRCRIERHSFANATPRLRTNDGDDGPISYKHGLFLDQTL